MKETLVIGVRDCVTGAHTQTTEVPTVKYYYYFILCFWI